MKNVIVNTAPESVAKSTGTVKTKIHVHIRIKVM